MRLMLTIRTYAHAHTPPPPPLGGNDDSSSSDKSEVKIEKNKRGIYKVKNAEMRLTLYSNALILQSCEACR